MFGPHFRYFIKPMGHGVLHCLRVHETDPRIPELIKTYNPVGWSTTIQYGFQPTVEQEIYQVKLSCHGWEKTVVIEEAEAAPSRLA